MRALRTLSKWLAEEGLTPDDVLASVKVPKAPQRELSPLTMDEERLLIRACDDRTSPGARRHAIVLLFLDTGLRLSELTGLLTNDTRLEDGYVTVIGKGRRQRSVSFGRRTEKALRNYALLHREPATADADRFFFLDRFGYPLSNEAVKSIFERLRRRTGIDRLPPHLLRHTHGIRSVEAGLPTLVIQARMGHSSPQVTERYAHASSSELIRRDRSFSHVDRLDIRSGGRRGGGERR